MVVAWWAICGGCSDGSRRHVVAKVAGTARGGETDPTYLAGVVGAMSAWVGRGSCCAYHGCFSFAVFCQQLSQIGYPPRIVARKASLPLSPLLGATPDVLRALILKFVLALSEYAHTHNTDVGGEGE